ncbi:MAG: acylneuraminate cytidylyltransferase family protein [Halocynthiibacter sp.]
MLICTICARGGSKGVKNKNVRIIGGKPLIAHTVEQARATHLFEHIAISSDSDAILEAAANAGADILIKRPAELATDEAAKIPVIQHCFREAEAQTGKTFDYSIDLDATSPLRLPSDIEHVVDMLTQDGTANVLTAMPARRSPYFNMLECGQDGVPHLSKPPSFDVVRRQDSPAVFDMNGSIYGWTREALLSMDTLFSDETRLYVMPEERSIDIDNMIDLKLVELLLAERGDK